MREVSFGGRRVLVGRARHVADGPQGVTLNVAGVSTMASAADAAALGEALHAEARAAEANNDIPYTDHRAAADAD